MDPENEFRVDSELAEPDWIKAVIDTSFIDCGKNTFTTNNFSSLPTPLKAPRLPQRRASIFETDSIASEIILRDSKKCFTPFQPEEDVPKSRFHSVNFNFIRSKAAKSDQSIKAASEYSEAHNFGNEVSTTSSYNKDDPQGNLIPVCSLNPSYLEETTEDPDISQKPGQACSSCRSKKKRCMHKGKGTKSSKESTQITSVTNEKQRDKDVIIGSSRTKRDGTPYQRIPHDRSKGPSMSKQAVDYRERKEIQRKYQDRLSDLLDGDIIDQVEQEGGTTPLGRLFKAAVRTLERVQQERVHATQMISIGSNTAGFLHRGIAGFQDRHLSESSTVVEDEFTGFREKLETRQDDSS